MDHEEFEGFVAASAVRLYNLALALTLDHAAAQDLTQTTMEKVYRAWLSKGPEDPHAYASATLVRAFYSDRRLRRNSHEKAADPQDSVLVSVRDESDGIGMSDTRMALLGALGALPARQREAVVLRFLEDMTVSDAARLMRCGEGNVKRLCHDGLKALRRVMDNDDAIGTTR